MEVNIKTMDILRQRNKVSKPCIDDRMPYDTNITKQIVEKDRKAMVDYKFELKKLNSILNSIKKD